MPWSLRRCPWQYAFQRVMSGVDLSQAKGKREAVGGAAVISAMDSAVEQSHYLQRLAATSIWTSASSGAAECPAR